MSKMSQLHAELTEQAYELGFESITEAEAKGYVIDYDKKRLVQSKELQKKNLVEAIDGLDKLQKELEKAHEEWLKEKEDVINDLKKLRSECFVSDDLTIDEKMAIINRTINFIEKGEI